MQFTSHIAHNLDRFLSGALTINRPPLRAGSLQRAEYSARLLVLDHSRAAVRLDVAIERDGIARDLVRTSTAEAIPNSDSHNDTS